MELAFIAPTKYTNKAIEHSDVNMALAHLCEDERYANSFASSDKYTFLDNSFYELRYCLCEATMLKAAKAVKADCVIMSDGTTDSIGVYKREGYEVMYIPTTVKEFKDAMYSDEIDKVGLSFFHVEQLIGSDKNNPASRYNFLRAYFEEGMDTKKIHMLGATDSMYEIALCKQWVGSWDSSAAVWGGLNNVDLRTQTTKNPLAVDFDTELAWNNLCTDNINFIKELTK
jgi:hypothetical protein